MRTTHQIRRAPGRPRNPRVNLTLNDIEGLNLQRFAHDAGWSTKDLAYAIGVQHTTLRLYLTGHKRIPDYRIEKIAQLVKVHPMQIRPNYQQQLELQGAMG